MFGHEFAHPGVRAAVLSLSVVRRLGLEPRTQGLKSRWTVDRCAQRLCAKELDQE